MRTREYWHYLCDRCKKLIKPLDMNRPTNSLDGMAKAGLFFQCRSRKGNTLHYCSEKCKNKHFHVGKGQ